ncbi:MAG: hypothetical protein ABMA13_04870 [Chthoniobacteraceae bacterium]
MTLTDEQKTAVAAWIDEGAKPADVQARLEKEFEIRMTYMEVRFLIDDLKVMPKDLAPPEPPKNDEPAPEAPTPLADETGELPTGSVSVKVDEITKPGVMASGRATFSDGKSAEWYVDQYGRLGMVPAEPGYRPPESDVAEFQSLLQREFAKLGLA